MSNETQEQATFTGTTHIGVVLDKSGSMGRVRKETIGGFNAWLKDQQELPDKVLLTLALFDTAYLVPIVATDLAKVNPLDESRYMPSGSTALLDAVGRTITEMESRGDSAKDRYLILILTDGEENASREITKERLQAMIQEREARGNWTFTYLSAGMDAFADAASIGIAAANTQAYTGDAIGTKAAFASVSRSSSALRSSASTASKSFYGGRTHAETEDRKTPPTAPSSSPWTSGDSSSASTSTASSWTKS